MRRTFGMCRVGLIAAAVLLTSCGGSDSTDVSAASGSSVGETTIASTSGADLAPPVDSSVEPAPSTAPTPTEPADTEPPSSTPDTFVIDMGDSAACMATTWILGAEQVERLFTETELSSVPGLTLDVEGQGLLDLRSDGTFTYTPAFTAAVTMLDISGDGEWSGTQEGVWGVDGDVLTMSSTANNITGSVVVGGGPEMPLPPLRTFEGQGRMARCDAATLDIELTTPVGVATYTLVIA